VPIYAYRCGACELEFDRLIRRPHGKEPTECPKCGEDALKRKLASFAHAHSELEVLQSLDPKYKQIVEDEMARTQYGEPMEHLKKMIPFSAADDPGDQIEF
jgi:putative FmdB family regulatory protein